MSLRQTVHTHRASVHQAAKLVAALLRVVGVSAGLAESNGSLQPGLWLTSPAGWLPRTGISSGTLCWVIEYGLPLPFLHRESKNKTITSCYYHYFQATLLFLHISANLLTCQKCHICSDASCTKGKELRWLYQFHLLVLVKNWTTQIITICFCENCLQCFDAVGWAAGRASGL